MTRDEVKRRCILHTITSPGAAGALVTFDARYTIGLPAAHASSQQLTLRLSHGLAPPLSFCDGSTGLAVTGLYFAGQVCPQIQIPWDAIYQIISPEMTAIWPTPPPPPEPTRTERVERGGLRLV